MKQLIILLVLCGGAYAIYSAVQASAEESREARTVQSLPPSVQHTVLKMDSETQAALFNEFERKRKKRSVAYIIWLLCGWHYLYTRQVGLQFAFWFTFGGLGIWWLVDLFRMPSIVRGCNEQIAREAIQTLALGNAFRTDPPPPV